MTKIKARGRWRRDGKQFVDKKKIKAYYLHDPLGDVIDGWVAWRCDPKLTPVQISELKQRVREYIMRTTLSPADAVALLVRKGWVEQTRYTLSKTNTLGATLWPDSQGSPHPVRVLIAPTPERAS